MKNTKKIEQINSKIADLQKLQKKIEDDFVQALSKDIAKILLKKKAYNIDKTALLKQIETSVDSLMKK